MKNVKLKSSVIAIALSFSVSALAEMPATNEQAGKLPVSFESVFEKSMNDPNVLFYYGDLAFQNGDFNSALKWMLEASRYDYEPAIENVKHMVMFNQGTGANRSGVVDFLSYYAQPRGGESPDVFAQVYLADYYRGDSCVWFSPEKRADCTLAQTKQDEPKSATDYEKSYFYFEGAAKQGDQRAKYVSGMMNILGLGVPRNVPLGINFLKPLAEEGQANIAYIIGKIYQDGYWMVSDREVASNWFQKAIAYNQHPSSMLEMAKNYESGVLGDSESERAAKAASLYNQVLESISATNEEKSESAFRLGLMYTHYPQYRDQVKALDFMEKAVAISDADPNEFGIKGLLWLGDREASTDLSKAVEFYLKAEKQLSMLPLNIQQRQAAVWQKLANAHATGQDGNMERSKRDYAFFMNTYHRVMSKTFIPSKEKSTYRGFSAFTFPG
ncbi:hypothetical protein [Alteromonas sp. 14N.309.X.WAT.G.H12]|uniref:tetratricopeptide repeat protein n=1 Tax=Alteromonas sp. 14N.309.X.WAT.G.H12 TaxID=3120824 RepID=UPI002FD3E153